jgi:L-amino acid N-acyltransferase YncA
MAVGIRAATQDDADAVAAVHVTSWDESYRELLPPEDFAKRTLDVRRSMWAKRICEPGRITLVACEENGAVVGFASALVFGHSDDGFDSYLQTLYLIESAKGRGTGSMLMRAMAAALRAAGARNMALRVLRLNSARRFYEGLGAHLVPEGITHDAGLFDDVVYAFDDLRALDAQAG